MSVCEVVGTIKRRLEMMDVGNNLDKRRKCRCGEEESTEHIIKCQTNRSIGRVKEEWIREVEKLEDIREMNNWMSKYCEQRIDEDEIQGKS